MASFLHRVGLFSFRRRRTVLAAWILGLVGMAFAAVAAGGAFSSEFRVPGTESQQALELLDRELPSAGVENATARLVVARTRKGRFDAADRRRIERIVERVSAVPGVARVAAPFEAGTVSRDGRVAFASIAYTRPANDLTVEDRRRVERAAATDGALQVALSSTGTPASEQHGVPPELIGVAVAVVVLLITFGSMIAAGLPLLTAAVGVGIGLTGVMLLSAFVELSDAVTAIAAMLGLAVGIDYALFIVSRHRAQASRSVPLESSVALAVGTAGSAVVFAGATVIIALVALAVTGVPFLTWMGLTAAFTVAVAVLVAITLVPAALGFAGARAIRGKRLEPGAGRPGARARLGERWVALVLRLRPLAVIVPIALTGALAVPALHLRLGLPDDSSAKRGTPERTAYDLVSKGFGPGFSGPLVVVAEPRDPASADRTTAALTARLRGFDGVAAAAPAGASADGSVAVLSVVPTSGPSTEATVDLVRAIRAAAPEIERETGATVAVTGQTAVNIDVADRMGQALVPYLAIVVVLAALLLVVAFRSVLVPATAIAGFLLTIAAALGAMVGIFQDGTGAGLFGVEAAPIVSLIPILMIGILFGLAMDYQVFLVSRMHESHARGDDAQAAIRYGVGHSARVVTAAALIMVSVFASFVIPPDPIVKSIGFALTLGILVDAFLIRMTLIPALMSYLGERAWYLPAWLDRVLPDVDLEGRALERDGGDTRPRDEAAAR